MAAPQSIPAVQDVEGRCLIYAALADVFLQPPTAEGLSQQRRWLSALLPGKLDWNALLTDIEAVRQAYFDCFFVPTSGSYVPPYESAVLAYTEKNKTFGRLNGPAAHHLAKCWEETAFSPETLTIYEPLRQNCMPDHIGLELAFMTYLCHAEKNVSTAPAADSGQALARKWRDYQAGFVADHLHPATGHFAPALQDIAPGYYAEVAAVAATWVETDLAELTQENREE